MTDESESDGEALNRLGHEALHAGDAERAVQVFAQAILQAPGDAVLHANMAAAYLALGRSGEALAHAERATRLDPRLAEAHHNLGNARFTRGDADGALAAFRSARDLNPESDAHWTNFLFAQVFADGVDGAALFAENRAWGARLERRVGNIARPRPRDPDPERPLRIAYYLPELDTHVTPRFIAPLLAHHDGARFQLAIYGDRTDGNPRPASLTHPMVRWVETRGLDAAALAERMRRDAIDVLVHPCTFKARYRIVLAHRAAPLQIAAINFMGTTGLMATDALVGDAVITPASDAACFTEQVICLPVFNTYRIPRDAPDVSDPPAARVGFVRFGSLNNPAKISARCVAAWTDILRRAPRSRLVLKHRAFDDPATRVAVQDRFARAGADPARIDFAGFTPEVSAYLAAYRDIDIALDPLPFSGGTTSYEAIWMGVPVLTLAGATPMARQTASFVQALGHPELVARDTDGYAERAAELAGDLAALGRTRAALRTEARATIFDAAGYTRGLEMAIRDLWRAACRRNFA